MPSRGKDARKLAKQRAARMKAPYPAQSPPTPKPKPSTPPEVVEAKRVARSRSTARGSDPKRIAAAKKRHEAGKPKPKPSGRELLERKLKEPPKSSGAMALAGRVPYIDRGDVKELEHAILGLPGGIYQIGKAAVHDAKSRPSLDPEDSQLYRIGRDMTKAMARDLRHPLRNPLMTALTASAVVSAGAGTAARASAAGKAATAAKAAGTSSAKAAAGAALKRPLPGVRVHQYEGQPIRGRYSTSAAARGVQRAADKAREKRGAPLLHPKPKTGEPRSTISTRHAERLLAEQRRITDAAGRGPALKAMSYAPRRGSSLTKRLRIYRGVTTPQEMAIRVVGQGVPIERVMADHLARAQVLEVRLKNLKNRGVPAGGHSNQLALRLGGEYSELLRKHELLKEARQYIAAGPDGRPVIAAAYPKLERATSATERAALTRESRAKKAGDLTREQAEHRKHAPGSLITTGELRVRAGAKGGKAIEVARSRTVPEAEVRLAELDARIEKATRKLAKEYKERIWDPVREELERYGGLNKGPGKGTRVVHPTEIVRYERGPLKGQVDLSRTPGGDYVEPSNIIRSKAPTMAQEARLWAEKYLAERGKQPGAHNTLKRIADEIEEADNLRTALAVEKERGTVFEGMTTSGEGVSLGTTTEFKGFEALEPYIGGRFRIPDTVPSKRQGHGPRAWRGGKPRKPGTLTKSYTGALQKKGTYTTQTIRAVAEDALEWERWDSVRRFAGTAYSFGRKSRPVDTRTRKWVPVKDPNAVRFSRQQARELREALKDKDIENLTPDEAVNIELGMKALEEQFFPGAEIRAHPPGTTISGIRWIDSRMLGSQKKIVTSVPKWDTVSDAVKGLILYGKPGYVAPNVVGNVALNIFQQGVLAPDNWIRAARLPRDLKFTIDEVMGSGFSRSIVEGTSSPISGAVRFAGNFWSYFVDDLFRRASFLHEARIRGIKTDAQLREFLDNPSHRGDLGEIGQRARDAIIDYERLGPYERDLIRRAIFVYPWVKGSTYYAGQFFRDHPILAGVFAKIGQEGKETADRELGPLPAWAEGSFKVGGSEDVPYVVNPSAISPFSTPMQVVATGMGELFGGGERSQQIGEMTNPLLQSVIEASVKRDLFTGRTLEGSFPRVLGSQITRGLPQWLLYQRIRDADKPETQEKAYPYTARDAWKQFVIGSSAPRPANLEVLNEQAQGTLNPSVRAKQRVEKERQNLYAALRVTDPSWLKGEDRKWLDQAFQRKASVDGLRASIRLEEGTGEPYARATLSAEADLLAKWRILTPADVRYYKRIARKGKIEDVKKARNELGTDFDTLYHKPIRDAEEAAKTE